jgi:hypothetical protein
MTQDRDFDRLAKAWLELGPDEAPDRIIASVLYATDGMPQARRPFRRPTWRPFPMTRQPVVATIVVAAVVLVGVGIVLTRSNQPSTVGVPIQTPVASPTPTPVASPTGATPLPTDLTPSSWVAPESGYVRLRISPPLASNGLATLSLTKDGDTSALGTASLASPGRFRISTAEDATCDAGQVGSYALALSADGTTLTITGQGPDLCSGRHALARTWTRSLVGDADGGTGTIELTGSVLRVTVPKDAGWVNNHYDTVDERYDDSTGQALRVWIDPQGFVDSCDNDRGVAAVSDAATFVAYLKANHAFRVAKTETMTIDGQPATHISLATKATTSDGPSCLGETALEIWPNWNEPFDATAEQWVVDLGRHWLVIEVEDGQPSAARDAEMRSIIDSIRFINLPS